MSDSTSPDLSRLIAAAGATTQAINNLNQTVGKSLQMTGVVSSAGASASKYLTIIGPDGQAYAIALLVPA